MIARITFEKRNFFHVNLDFRVACDRLLLEGLHSLVVLLCLIFGLSRLRFDYLCINEQRWFAYNIGGHLFWELEKLLGCVGFRGGGHF